MVKENRRDGLSPIHEASSADLVEDTNTYIAVYAPSDL
jgi:hypothetical protein